ncbi:SPFH domain-containing protein [Halorussus halobius]|uniref:SPFH domain-containing protein n=1 Tax=Halorussus halobius TaxID=1710537 RepID=UPI001091B63C|nr:SPFH domain-containing protein [Halorussus halobius]
MSNPFYELGRLTAGVDLSGALAVGVAVLALFFVLPLSNPAALVGLLALGVAVAVLASAVEVVDATEKRALTVFGEYRKLLEPGLNVVPPLISRTHSFDVRTQMLDVPPQEAITEDNSPVTADAVIYVRVVDAEKAYLEVDDYRKAVSNLAQTTLRAVIGDMELDDTLKRREEINARIGRELDRPTDEWGVRIEAVEVQEVMPTATVVSAMEQQTAAERRRRAMILEAQGERRSAIEQAEGDKQSNVIRAQGEKQSQILEAQGDAVSTVLRAKSAESMGERAVIDKGMETLESIGQGESTTFVLPQEVSSLLGRYGKHLTGSDVSEGGESLESLDFDADTAELLGMDDVEGMVAGLNGDSEVEVAGGESDLESTELSESE